MKHYIAAGITASAILIAWFAFTRSTPPPDFSPPVYLNPKGLEFKVSADHDIKESNQFLVSGYKLQFLTRANVIVSELYVGKPRPDDQGYIVLDLRNISTQVPRNVDLKIRVVSNGPGGDSYNDADSQWVRFESGV